MQLQKTVRALNRIKLRSHVLSAVIKIVRALMFGLVAVALWAIIKPEAQLEQVCLGLLAVVATLILSNWRSRTRISETDVVLSLEIDHQETSTPAASLREQGNASPEWSNILGNTKGDLRRYEGHRLIILLSTLLIPAIIIRKSLRD